MDLWDVQTRLKAMQLYGGAIDGKFGPFSKAAIEALFAHQQVTGFANWKKQRRIIAAGQVLCRIDGIETGKIDGLLGPQTRHAFDIYEARKRGDKGAETWRDAEQDKPPLVAAPPAATTWPRQSDCLKFYGPVGSNQVSITVPYPLKLAWDTSKTLKKITCHKKVAEPARRVLERVLAHYGLDEIRRLRLDLFGGSLNVRRMRGGSAWSMHAWGIAFAFDPERNQLKWHKPKAAFSAPEYKPWFEAWSAEGAIGLGPCARLRLDAHPVRSPLARDNPSAAQAAVPERLTELGDYAALTPEGPSSQTRRLAMDQAKWVAWSLGIWGAVVTALTAALPAFNAMLVFFFGVDWSIEPSWIAALDENMKMVITGLGGIIGVVMMFWGRWRAKAPLTLVPPSWKGGA